MPLNNNNSHNLIGSRHVYSSGHWYELLYSPLGVLVVSVPLPSVAGGGGLAAVDRHVGVVAARLQRHDTLPVVLDIIVISETNQDISNRLLSCPDSNLLSLMLRSLSLGLSYLSLSLISLSLSMSLSLMSLGSLLSLESLKSLGLGSTYRTEWMLLLLLLRLLLSARRSSSNDIFQIFKLSFLFLYETAWL